MGRLTVAMCVGVFVIIMALLPVAEDAAAVLEIEKGNYWTYSAEVDAEGMSISASLKMKVVGTEGSGASAVYLIDISGSGDVSGNYDGSTVSGDVDFSGEEKRLVSNFSLVSSELEMEIGFSMQGQKADMTMSMLAVYSPSLDDFIGDSFPGYGATVTSTSTVTATMSMEMEFLGETFSDSYTITEVMTQTIQIAATNQTVVVPAGSFDCYKYTKTVEMGGEISVLTFYYSSEVGNFVKTTGSDGLLTVLGDTELKSFSYAGRGAGASSLFSGTNLLLIVLAVVAVVVIVVALLVMRRRGRAQAQMMPPPPPPPPPDQPAP